MINMPAMRISDTMHVGQGPDMAYNECTARRKRGRPMGAKYS